MPADVSPAANDPDHYKDGTLKALVEATGNACITHEFKEMKHGWVPRGDASDPKGRWRAARRGARDGGGLLPARTSECESIYV